MVAGKWAYSKATNHDLRWVLYPTSSILAISWDTGFIYDMDLGYVFEDKEITVDRSCSGINFMLILISAGIALLSPLGKRSWVAHSLIAVGLLIGSFLVTLIANTSRILSLYVTQPLEKSLEIDMARWLHGGIGALVYLIFLFATFSLIHFLLRSKLHPQS